MIDLVPLRRGGQQQLDPGLSVLKLAISECPVLAPGGRAGGGSAWFFTGKSRPSIRGGVDPLSFSTRDALNRRRERLVEGYSAFRRPKKQGILRPRRRPRPRFQRVGADDRGDCSVDTVRAVPDSVHELRREAGGLIGFWQSARTVRTMRTQNSLGLLTPKNATRCLDGGVTVVRR